jgi:hypothetical protein
VHFQQDSKLLPDIKEEDVELRLAIRIRMVEKRIYGQLLGQLYRQQPVLVLDAIQDHISVPMMEALQHPPTDAKDAEPQALATDSPASPTTTAAEDSNSNAANIDKQANDAL